LYPIGADSQPSTRDPSIPSGGKSKFVVAFAGNLGNWYGTMLEELISVSQDSQSAVEFRIFGSNPSWSPAFDKRVKTSGVFRGMMSFEDLRREMMAVDALLLPMGFGEECALTERTSFKTKFLDYLSFEKPILVWGPEYCSAVRYAKEFDSAATCLTPNAGECLKTIFALAGDSQRQAALVANAQRMYRDRFHPDRIHAGFVKKIQATIETFPTKK
jgi:hypothetical protein